MWTYKEIIQHRLIKDTLIKVMGTDKEKTYLARIEAMVRHGEISVRVYSAATEYHRRRLSCSK